MERALIDDSNPNIDVNELMAKVHEQIATHAVPSILSGRGGLRADITTMVARIDEALVAAESSSQVRTTLGRSTRLFRGFPMLQELFLRALTFIFRDQRNVNASIVEALRTSLQLNVRLCEDIDHLKRGLETVKSTEGSSAAKQRLKE